MKKFSLVFLYSFILNWIWENAHSALYYLPNGEPITQFILLRSTFIDAVFITLFASLFFYIPFLKKNTWLVIPLGIALAIVIEWRALEAGRWAYTALMPIIPVVNTGLTPTMTRTPNF